ncbi:serine-rich adhesin for platelets-like [Watersipora subatra]|uniref:serine-rich adhesin for platelets-like n=1 Tax=Watersipora subatra TaxID=2589382 RepID=UPI00355B2C61
MPYSGLSDTSVATQYNRTIDPDSAELFNAVFASRTASSVLTEADMDIEILETESDEIWGIVDDDDSVSEGTSDDTEDEKHARSVNQTPQHSLSAFICTQTKDVVQEKSMSKSKEAYFCDRCEYSTEDFMVFITHNNEHREREQRPAKVFTCGMCTYETPEAELMAKHIQLHLSTKPISSSSMSEIEEVNEKSDDDEETLIETRKDRSSFSDSENTDSTSAASMTINHNLSKIHDDTGSDMSPNELEIHLAEDSEKNQLADSNDNLHVSAEMSEINMAEKGKCQLNTPTETEEAVQKALDRILLEVSKEDDLVVTIDNSKSSTPPLEAEPMQDEYECLPEVSQHVSIAQTPTSIDELEETVICSGDTLEKVDKEIKLVGNSTEHPNKEIGLAQSETETPTDTTTIGVLIPELNHENSSISSEMHQICQNTGSREQNTTVTVGKALKRSPKFAKTYTSKKKTVSGNVQSLSSTIEEADEDESANKTQLSTSAMKFVTVSLAQYRGPAICIPSEIPNAPLTAPTNLPNPESIVSHLQKSDLKNCSKSIDAEILEQTSTMTASLNDENIFDTESQTSCSSGAYKYKHKNIVLAAFYSNDNNLTCENIGVPILKESKGVKLSNFKSSKLNNDQRKRKLAPKAIKKGHKAAVKRTNKSKKSQEQPKKQGEVQAIGVKLEAASHQHAKSHEKPRILSSKAMEEKVKEISERRTRNSIKSAMIKAPSTSPSVRTIPNKSEVKQKIMKDGNQSEPGSTTKEKIQVQKDRKKDIMKQVSVNTQACVDRLRKPKPTTFSCVAIDSLKQCTKENISFDYEKVLSSSKLPLELKVSIPTTEVNVLDDGGCLSLSSTQHTLLTEQTTEDINEHDSEIDVSNDSATVNSVELPSHSKPEKHSYLPNFFNFNPSKDIATRISSQAAHSNLESNATLEPVTSLTCDQPKKRQACELNTDNEETVDISFPTSIKTMSISPSADKPLSSTLNSEQILCEANDCTSKSAVSNSPKKEFLNASSYTIENLLSEILTERSVSQQIVHTDSAALESPDEITNSISITSTTVAEGEEPHENETICEIFSVQSLLDQKDCSKHECRPSCQSEECTSETRKLCSDHSNSGFGAFSQDKSPLDERTQQSVETIPSLKNFSKIDELNCLLQTPPNSNIFSSRLSVDNTVSGISAEPDYSKETARAVESITECYDDLSYQNYDAVRDQPTKAIHFDAAVIDSDYHSFSPECQSFDETVESVKHCIDKLTVSGLQLRWNLPQIICERRLPISRSISLQVEGFRLQEEETSDECEMASDSSDNEDTSLRMSDHYFHKNGVRMGMNLNDENPSESYTETEKASSFFNRSLSEPNLSAPSSYKKPKRDILLRYQNDLNKNLFLSSPEEYRPVFSINCCDLKSNKNHSNKASKSYHREKLHRSKNKFSKKHKLKKKALSSVFASAVSASQWESSTKKKKHSKPKQKKLYTQLEPPYTKIYRCEFCDFSTKVSPDLVAHTKRMHTEDEKVYMCQECDYITYRQSKLVAHGKSHTVFEEELEDEQIHSEKSLYPPSGVEAQKRNVSHTFDNGEIGNFINKLHLIKKRRLNSPTPVWQSLY